MEWYKWCRLCGCDDESQFDIFIKTENSSTLAECIEQFFSISITEADGIPKKICCVCKNFLIYIRMFWEKARIIEKMFLELEFNLKNDVKYNAFEIKSKYLQSTDPSKEIMNSERIFCSNFELTGTVKEEDSNFETEIHECQEEDRNTGEKLNTTFDEFSDTSHSDKIYTNQADKLKDNISIKTKCQDTQMKDHQVKQTQMKKEIECDKCQASFSRESNYIVHLKRAHNFVKPLLPCSVCGKTCKTRQKLKLHMELHLPPAEREKLLFKCTQCEQKFTQKGAMRSHIRTQHSLEKPVICEQCGKKFPSRAHLWSHVRSHDDQNHLTCPKCPKIFKNQFRLRVHMRGHNESSHPCSICGLILKTSQTLKNHMFVHSDDKPFKCNFCGKDFKRDKNLQNHLITHSGLRPFVCRFCGQSYANRSNCKKHEKHAHPAEYEAAAMLLKPEPQQKTVKKLPNIQQLEVILSQIKSEQPISANKIS